MKKFFLTIITVLLNITALSAHTQYIHMYLTQEGYSLLRNHLGTDVTEILNHIGNGSVGPIWTNKNILSGAWREDEEDIVYGYGYPFDWVVSISHFWDADNGDFSYNTFQLERDLGNIGPYRNAYDKIRSYAYSNQSWEIIYTFPQQGQYCFNLVNGGNIFLTTFRIGLKYTDIIELYKTGRVKISSWYRIADGTKVPCDYDVILGPDYREIFVWEILGRMCHLIQDMSIPAHSRCDEHGMSADDYEKWISEKYHWTYWNANNSGSLLNPYVSSNPLHYLMYTTQQIANHFGSTGPYCSVGNNSIGGNPLPEEISYLNSINLSTLGDPMGQGPFYDVTEENIRNKTLPQAIRATAGLLYWFVKEADLFPKPLTAVNVSGDTELYAEMTGHWYTTLTNGIAPFTYSWEMKFAGNELMASNEVRSSKVIRPNLPPSNYWIPTGTNSPYYSTTQNPNDLRDFYLRCTVTDATNTTKISNEFYVIVSPDPPPLGKEIASNNKVQSNLMEEKEIKENSLGNYPNPFNPTTVIKYSLKEKDKITLIVYDMIGKEVARLVDGIQNEGEHSVSFDGSSLPSGMYIYQLKGTNFILNKKMLLVK